jgi:hypothetical protein
VKANICNRSKSLQDIVFNQVCLLHLYLCLLNVSYIAQFEKVDSLFSKFSVD